VLLADNLLLSGAILDDDDRSSKTQAMRMFTRRIMEGDRWTASIVPIRDGLLLATLA
jgi:predicted O-methyltransferase YrrM